MNPNCLKVLKNLQTIIFLKKKKMSQTTMTSLHGRTADIYVKFLVQYVCAQKGACFLIIQLILRIICHIKTTKLKVIESLHIIRV